MDLNKFTEKAQGAVVSAQELATSHHHGQIEPEHLLLALVSQEGGIAPQVFRKLEVDPGLVQQRLEEALGKMPQVHGAAAQVYVSPRLQQVFNVALEEAGRLRDEYVSTEHLLIGIGDERVKGAAYEILKSLGVTRESIYQVLTSIRGSQRVTDANPEGKYQALEKYSRPGRGDTPGDSGPFAPHQEQPGTHRRPRGGQDRHRGGAGTARRSG
jgi:ATP-dependent Clp protease ATP-binding subunit ClpB